MIFCLTELLARHQVDSALKHQDVFVQKIAQACDTKDRRAMIEAYLVLKAGVGTSTAGFESRAICRRFLLAIFRKWRPA